ncbi:Melanophilin, partial [Chaetura pelagica]
ELKGRIQQESSKRQFLSSQSHLKQTLCARCLRRFPPVLPGRRSCQRCRFYICRSCSQARPGGLTWLCLLSLGRIVKEGSLDWYYEHVRSRFKRFGSAKVLQSLHGRIQPAQGVKNSTFLGLQDRVYSLPDISSECHLTSGSPGEDSDDEDGVLGGAEAECYSRTRRTRRLLSVHPLDLELEPEFSARPRRHSGQFSPSTTSPGAFQPFPDGPSPAEDASQEPGGEEAELVFHLQEQGAGGGSPQRFSTHLLLTLSAGRSLEGNPEPGSPWSQQPRCSADMDTSDEDTKGAQLLSQHPMRGWSRTSSQESISQARNEIQQLHQRVSALERLLSRLEGNVLGHPQSPAPESPLDPDAEEEELKRKLEELASNISDKEISSEEEVEQEEKKAKKPEMSSSSEDMDRDAQKGAGGGSPQRFSTHLLLTLSAGRSLEGNPEPGHGPCLPPPLLREATPGEGTPGSFILQRILGCLHLVFQVDLTAGKFSQLQGTLQELEGGPDHPLTTDSELSELEDKVASTAARVQQAESEVSDIEARIAALSAAGLTVKAKKKTSGQATSLLSSSPTSSSPGESADDVKVAPLLLQGLQGFRRRFHSPLNLSGLEGSFERNSASRGSLTQRNPGGSRRR